jgi:Fe-S cluster assembly iron-binding protein IscA
MFQLTSSAAFTIDEARRQSQIPTNYGVRLSGRRSPAGDVGLEITFVEAPAPSDTVFEQHGTQMFIAEEVAGPLADIALDVSPAAADNGASPTTQLVLRPQEPGESA